ncbi:MAG: competence protein ComFB [Gammaproteobacteria bacterium]|nr:MAG: competence protein ComFB [Gammaproteobacteria bacterium]
MSILDNISNYYEKLVLEELAQQAVQHAGDDEFLTDVACVALNSLPARYYRHGVDMAFYLPSGEYLEMKSRVKLAVAEAIARVEEDARTASDSGAAEEG